MRKILVLLLLVVPCFGQGALYKDNVVSQLGKPIAGVSVKICVNTTGCTATPIYSDAAMTAPIPSSTVITDALGEYSFYAIPGIYKRQASGPSITTSTGTIQVSSTNPIFADGADMCAKIANVADAGALLIDATYFTGTQACATDFASHLKEQTVLELGAVVINSSVQQTTITRAITIRGKGPGQTKLFYTGAGAIDGVLKTTSPADSAGKYGLSIEGMSIAGNANTTFALNLYMAPYANVRDVQLWAATSACLNSAGAVGVHIQNVQCSSLMQYTYVLPATPVPQYGAIFDAVGGMQTTAGTVVDFVAEGYSVAGVYLKSASTMVFTGGGAQMATGTGFGVRVDAASAQNTFIGFDMEANGGAYDVLDNGKHTTFINPIMISGTLPIQLGATSDGFTLIGGNLYNDYTNPPRTHMSIDAGSKNIFSSANGVTTASEFSTPTGANGVLLAKSTTSALSPSQRVTFSSLDGASSPLTTWVYADGLGTIFCDSTHAGGCAFNAPKFTISGLSTTGKSLCSKPDKSIGYCSTVVAADGSCTCN